MLWRACWISIIAVRIASAQNAAEQAPDFGVLTAQQLFTQPGAMTEGANVRLDGVVVRAKSGNVLRVAVGNHEIFVTPDDPTGLAFVTVGARVDVLGSLRRSPSARQAELIYAMGSREAHRLARTKFYVHAWSVSALE